jgi:hypothetical protein
MSLLEMKFGASRNEEKIHAVKFHFSARFGCGGKRELFNFVLRK